MHIDEIITEVIIDSEGSTRQDSAPEGAVPDVDSAATVELVVRIQDVKTRRRSRLEVDE